MKEREYTSLSFFMLIYKLHYAVLRERQVAIMKESMCEIPKSQRPYEKCLREGTAVLSDIELLAVILEAAPEETVPSLLPARY